MPSIDETAELLGVGRTTLYKYIKLLETPIHRQQTKGNKASIDEKDLPKLQELAKWAKDKENQGKPLSQFPGIIEGNNAIEPTIMSSEITTESSTGLTEVNGQYTLFDVICDKICDRIIPQLTNKKSPINHWELLDTCAAKKYLLSTSEIREMIGTKPVGAEYIRGSFKFNKVGKIGSQASWRVTRID